MLQQSVRVWTLTWLGGRKSFLVKEGGRGPSYDICFRSDIALRAERADGQAGVQALPLSLICTCHRSSTLSAPVLALPPSPDVVLLSTVTLRAKP